MADSPHALLHMLLGADLLSNRAGLQPLVNCRVRVSERPRRYRIPDICLAEPPIPIAGPLLRPPVLTVEILSPDDRFADIVDRARDLWTMGTRHFWVADAERRVVYVYDGVALTNPGTLLLQVPEYGIAVDFARLFDLAAQRSAAQG